MTNRDYSSLLPELTMEEIQKREERGLSVQSQDEAAPSLKPRGQGKNETDRHFGT